MQGSRLGRYWPVLVLVGLLLVPAGTLGASVRAPAAVSSHWVTDMVGLPARSLSRPLPGTTELRLTVTLEPSHASGLSSFLSAVSDPRGPGYRHFLTEAQFQAEFSPAPAQDAAVAAYFQSYGATATAITADRFGVSFDLPASALPRAIGVTAQQVGSYRGAPLFTSTGTVSLPSSVGGLIQGIGGLSDLAAASYDPHTARLLPMTSTAHTPAQFVLGLGGQPWFVGSDVAQASGTSRLFPGGGVANGTFPTREAVATLLLSGYNQSTNVDLPPFDPVVVQSYFNDTFAPGWPHPTVVGVPVSVGGVTPPMPGSYNGSNDTTLDETENSLDLEMAGSLAPGATLVNFYISASLIAAPGASPSTTQLADDFAQSLAAALTHNYSPASLAVVSGSFGLSDVNDALWNTELQNAAATGVTVVFASGDQGNAPDDLSGRGQGQWPGWPATATFDSNGAIAVGGVQFTLSGAANGSYYPNGTLNASYDPAPGSYTGLSAWYDTAGGAGNYSGSEGGVSAVYGEPGWQLDSAAQPTIANVTVAQGSFSLGRTEPDVSFAAYSMVAYVARDSGGVYYTLLEGTSISAPLFAGFLASSAAVRGTHFGFLDPELYRIGSYFAASPNPADDPFLDITNGSNYAFSAGPGWDGTTGWGTLYAPWFLLADANKAVSGYQYTGPTPGLPPLIPLHYGPPPLYFLVFVGVAAVLAVVAVIAILRPRATGPHPPPYSYLPPPAPSAGPLPPHAPSPGALGAPAPSYGYAPAPSFLCPYCGHPRPAEPVRCPTCGRY